MKRARRERGAAGRSGGRARRGRGGAALLLVLWAVMILSIAVMTSARLVELDLDAGAQQNRRFEARLHALTGLNLALNDKVRRGDPLLAQKPAPDTSFEVRILSEGTRLNINKVLASRDPRKLRSLFEFWGLDMDEASVAVDSLKDWTDRDNLRSLHGAEADDLPPESGYSVPQNRPFYSVEEMAGVRGMERVAAVKPDWRDAFSVFSSGKLDLQDASSEMLQVFGGLSRAQAAELIRYRNGPDGLPFTVDDVILKSAAQVAAIIPIDEAQRRLLAGSFDVANNPYRITSVGRAAGTRYEITAVVTARGRKLDTVLLDWKEK